MNQNHSSSFSFIGNNVISFFSSRKKASISSFVCSEKTSVSCYEQKYQVTNVGGEKIKLSRLLAQPINEFKINAIQRKTPQ